MRSMWKGAISFGLVTIPVKLYAATEQRDIAFRQVHRTDGGRIRFQRICSIDGEEVPYADVAKGYELPDGEMVVLTDDDLADLPLPTTRSIEVVEFTPAEQLDPILFSRSYYIEPDASGTRAYVLLRDALDQSGKIAVARVALRQRETLAALRTREGVLVLETLLWPDEIRKADFPFLDTDVTVRPQELKMATSLIDSMTVDFDPSEFHDGYREALEELVAAKVEGLEIAHPVEREPEEPAGSLVDALRASLEARDDGAAAGSGKSGSSGSGKSSGSSGSGRAKSGKAAAPAKAASSGKSASGRSRSRKAAGDESEADEAASGAEAKRRPRRKASA
ncbi:MAG TPA: Ku protein [Streptosporangiaceae bacterium]|jgi:DNA end-binding protein Ku|nr:Ku protein [Streptosporangiaceae bacterium]